MCPPQRRIVLPGGRQPTNPAHRTAGLLASYAVVVVGAWSLGWGLGRLADRHPVPDCVDITRFDTWPALDYDGTTDAWSYNGNVVGYSAVEDATCITPPTRP